MRRLREGRRCRVDALAAMRVRVLVNAAVPQPIAKGGAFREQDKQHWRNGTGKECEGISPIKILSDEGKGRAGSENPGANCSNVESRAKARCRNR